jgi:hypothetical protein
MAEDRPQDCLFGPSKGLARRVPRQFGVGDGVAGGENFVVDLAFGDTGGAATGHLLLLLLLLLLLVLLLLLLLLLLLMLLLLLGMVLEILIVENGEDEDDVGGIIYKASLWSVH